LRNWADAILVGGETIRQDDPSLTVREFKVDNQPKVAILSSKIKREETKYFKDGRDVFVYKLDNDFTWQDLLLDLGKNEVTALLIEGGGEVAASALFANAVDKVEFHIAPKILGGADSRSVVGGENPKSLVDALNLIEVNVENCGSDIIVTGYVGDK
jgi:diaminohydroxyphosphoribosylaminopyrimidine deaminase/5-amino-6-(5-phosphoribosylamino)uracil reductase